MADEIRITANLVAAKGTSKFSRSESFTVDWSTAVKDGQTQAVGTTYEAITISGDVATNGWAYFTNLDSTNYVEIGREVAATFYPVIRLNAGESMAFRLAQGVALFARANTASVNLDWTVLGN